jgi:hypothetical protein
VGYQQDNSQHESTELTTDTNPSSYHYIQNALLPEVDKAEVVAKTANEVAYTDGATKTWANVGGVQTVTLEDASNIDNASGTFGDPARALKDDVGGSLVEGTDYYYDYRIDTSTGDIYDADNSGSFNSGEYLRIVENGVNITNAGGLNLQVYAKNLANLITPPETQAYVDPSRGKFVLPRPLYWDKYESSSVLSSAEIYDTGNSPTETKTTHSGVPVWDTTSLKFNNGIRLTADFTGSFVNGNWRVYPFGTDTKDFNKGTLSCWFKVTHGVTPANAQADIMFGACKDYAGTVDLRTMCDTDGWMVGFGQSVIPGTSTVDAKLYYSTVEEDTDSSLSSSNTYHLYVVWDRSLGLTGGKAIRVFVNNTEILSSTNAFTDMSSFNFRWQLYAWSLSASNPSNSICDNLKIWNHVVSENPSFEYNAGTGREDALHEMYTSTGGYTPINLDVGYHYAPSVTDPAKLEEDGATEGYLTWDLDSGYTRAGVNFVMGTSTGVAKITVTEDPNGTPNVILNGATVDLYNAENGETADLEMIYWITLDETKDHEIKVEHNGTHNASAFSPYYIQVREYLTVETLDNAEVEAILTVSHSTWSAETKTYTMALDTTTSLEKYQSFNGDTSTTDFVLSGTNRAYEPVKFSTDGGSTWKYPSDTDLSWGSNATDYDDETVDSNGHFGVKFDSAPGSGTGNVQIYYIPAVDTYKINTALKFANDGVDYTETRGELRLQDHNGELIL